MRSTLTSLAIVNLRKPHVAPVRGLHLDLPDHAHEFRDVTSYILSPASASQTACVTCSVVALPPRSGVCSEGSAVMRSTARINRTAADFSPRCSSIMLPDQKVATGLAMPLPTMSKAEPWIGSNIEGNLR